MLQLGVLFVVTLVRHGPPLARNSIQRGGAARISAVQTLSQVDAATAELFDKQKALAEQKRLRAERYQQLMSTMVAPLLALQSLTGWVARLEPHDIGVITVRLPGPVRLTVCALAPPADACAPAHPAHAACVHARSLTVPSRPTLCRSS